MNTLNQSEQINRDNLEVFSKVQERDGVSLKAQLEREISCLVKQLERLKYLDGYLDNSTIKTYEDMISSRKDMLGELR
ncbi:hypothetical protein TDB9533_03833 [Thalassocella blandensis]|nr:hypothetical protein TDB9533_03833 [Thalassocella blandensis]